MARAVNAKSWQISGDYFETCNSDYVCPCIYTNVAGEPTHWDCHFAMVLHVDRGGYGDTHSTGSISCSPAIRRA